MSFRKCRGGFPALLSNTPIGHYILYLTYSRLAGSNLSKAILSKADLTGADLTGANLSGTDLSGATWINGERCKDGSVGSCGRQ